MEYPKLAALDGDILAYRAAHWADVEGVDELEDRLAHDISAWTPNGVDKAVLCFSCPRHANYRRDFWPKYKAHRDSSKSPDSLDYALEILYSNSKSACVDRLEADDLMGMIASGESGVAVTIDKDLRTVPGWHWNPDKEEEPVYVDLEDADMFFYTQWMTGDTTDNIPGLWRVGPKKAEKILVNTPRDEWEEKILDMYRNETRPETKQVDMSPEEFALSMARCVRILRKGEYDKQSREVTLWNPIVGLGINKP
jgi:DNA polymerase-1